MPLQQAAPRQWLQDWDDGVNYFNNHQLLQAHAAGVARNASALRELIEVEWSPRGGVVLGVFEPFATAMKMTFAFALGGLPSRRGDEEAAANAATAPPAALPPGDPSSYALLARIVHIMNAVLLHVLSLRVLGLMRDTTASSAPSSSPPRALESDSWAAAIAAAVWAVHPLRTEAVGWLSCLPYNFAALNVVLATHAYLSSSLSTPIGCLCGLLARIFFAFSALCKAPASALPLALLVLDTVLTAAGGDNKESPPSRRRVAAGSSTVSSGQNTSPSALSLLLEVARVAVRQADLLVLMAMFVAAAHVANIINNGTKGDDIGGSSSDNDSWWEKLHSNQYLWAGDVLSRGQIAVKALNALHWYSVRTVWPFDLAMIYPVPKGWPLATKEPGQAVGAVLSAATSLCCLALAVWSGHFLLLLLLKKRRCREQQKVPAGRLSVASGGAAWAASSALLLPTLGFVQHGWPVFVADRYFHIASMVWALPMAALLRPTVQLALMPAVSTAAQARSDPLLLILRARARAAVGTMLILILALAAQSSHESVKWRNSSNLWLHAALVTPKDCTATYNLACVVERVARANPLELLDSPLLARNRNNASATGGSLHYLSRTPVPSEQRADMALALQLEGMREAEALFAKAVDLEPTYGAAYNNRGQLAERRGGNDGLQLARECYSKAIELNAHTHYKAYNNLASLLHRQGTAGLHDVASQEALLGAAEKNYRRAISIFPGYHLALFNLATLLHTTGRHWSTEATLEGSKPPQMNGTAAAEALDLYRASIRANPSMAEAHYNYASLLLREFYDNRLGDGGKDPDIRVAILQEIVSHLEAANKLRPNHRATTDTLGYVRSLAKRGGRRRHQTRS